VLYSRQLAREEAFERDLAHCTEFNVTG